MSKVIHLTSVHPSTDTRIFLKECRTLAQNGHEVHLVSTGSSNAIIDGVHLHSVKKSGNRVTRMMLGGFRVTRKGLTLDGQIYHLHDPELIPFGLFLKMRGKRVIYDAHEDTPKDIMSKPWVPVPLRRFASVCYRMLEMFCLRRVDAVITVHEKIATRLRQVQPSIWLVRNYPILDHDYAVPEDRIRRFVWLGMLSPIRGSQQIMTALQKIPGARLDVIGQIRESVKLTPEVTYLGEFPQQEAFRTASRYLAGLVTFLPAPNHVDALPNKLFEYMSLGLPVIASDFPGWHHIVQEAGAGLFVDPESPESIAEALKWVLDHPQEAREMGENGRRAVHERYSWATEAKQLLKLYSGLES